MKCAVVYYSNSGNTKRIAEAIGRRFGAELIFVEPEEPYGGFLSAVARVVREHKNAEDPRPKRARADLSGCDLIFLGFPVWAGTMPRFLQAFVRNSAPSGKTIIPFATAMAPARIPRWPRCAPCFQTAKSPTTSTPACARSRT